MAKNKDDLGKELMQCIAFAHFAVKKYSGSTSNDHEQSFYELFDSNNKISTTSLNVYKKHLGSKFDFERIRENWKNETTKTGQVSVNITTKIVYDVAKKFYLSNLMSKNFDQYEFLDQTDEFVETVKKESLTKILKAMRLPYKIDILSSADMYIVRKNVKKVIINQLKKEILNQSDAYLMNNFDKYNDILIERWKSHDLFGISLKLPESNQNKNIKIIGVPDNILSKKMKGKVDPYMKFLAMLSDPKTDVQKLIDETIEIGDFDLTKAAWKFPFKFKYKKLGLYESDVNFNLMAWPKAQGDGGGTASFNGQFFNTTGYSSQWVGGTGTSTIESFLFQYPEFDKIMNELISIRRKAFNYALTGSASKAPNINQIIDARIKFQLKGGVAKELKYNKTGTMAKWGLKKGESKGGVIYTANKKTAELKIKNLQTLYAFSVRELSQKHFLIGSTRHAKLSVFFKEYDQAMGTQDTLLKYMTAVHKLSQKKSLSSSGERLTDSMVNTFYEHSQISYFLVRGGPSLYKYLKQRIFLTVFGVITKKAYKVFQKSNASSLWNSTQVIGAIKSQISKKLAQNIKSFDTVPHFYMS
jgi:hypothetical protein